MNIPLNTSSTSINSSGPQQQQQQRGKKTIFNKRELDEQDPLELNWRDQYEKIEAILGNVNESEVNSALIERASESQERATDIAVGLLFALLTTSSGAGQVSQQLFKYLTFSSKDSLNSFCTILRKLIGDKFYKLNDNARAQVVWIFNELVSSSHHDSDSIAVLLLKQIGGGNVSARNIQFETSILAVLRDHRQWIYSKPQFIPMVVYTFLRLLQDHLKPSFSAIREQETALCVDLLKNKFTECTGVGRDLARLVWFLANVGKLPEFDAIWRNMNAKPSPMFPGGDITALLRVPTPKIYLANRLGPETETQITFMMREVRTGTQAVKKYQQWFVTKWLGSPEAESLVPDLVRYICDVYHPPNYVLCSDILPRWILLFWLIKVCKVELWKQQAKLALFYDWMFYDSKADSIMNIEPAMLLIANSVKKYAEMANEVLDAINYWIEIYDPSRRDQIRQNIFNGFSTCQEKTVVHSLTQVLAPDHFAQPVFDRFKSNFPTIFSSSPVLSSSHGNIPQQPPQTMPLPVDFLKKSSSTSPRPQSPHIQPQNLQMSPNQHQQIHPQPPPQHQQIHPPVSQQAQQQSQPTPMKVDSPDDIHVNKSKSGIPLKPQATQQQQPPTQPTPQQQQPPAQPIQQQPQSTDVIMKDVEKTTPRLQPQPHPHPQAQPQQPTQQAVSHPVQPPQQTISSPQPTTSNSPSESSLSSSSAGVQSPPPPVQQVLVATGPNIPSSQTAQQTISPPLTQVPVSPTTKPLSPSTTQSPPSSQALPSQQASTQQSTAAAAAERFEIDENITLDEEIKIDVPESLSAIGSKAELQPANITFTMRMILHHFNTRVSKLDQQAQIDTTKDLSNYLCNILKPELDEFKFHSHQPNPSVSQHLSNLFCNFHTINHLFKYCTNTIGGNGQSNGTSPQPENHTSQPILLLLKEMYKMEPIIGCMFMVWSIVTSPGGLSLAPSGTSYIYPDIELLSGPNYTTAEQDLYKVERLLEQVLDSNPAPPINAASDTSMLSFYCKHLVSESNEQILNDFRVTQYECGDSILFYLLPFVYKYLPQISIGNADLLYFLLNHIDPMQHYRLCTKLSLGEFRIFGNSAYSLVDRSFQWESFEQNYVWQLLLSEDSFHHHAIIMKIFPLVINKIDPSVNSEVLLNLTIAMKEVSVNNKLFIEILSLPNQFHPFPFNIFSSWLSDQQSHIQSLTNDLFLDNSKLKYLDKIYYFLNLYLRKYSNGGDEFKFKLEDIIDTEKLSKTFKTNPNNTLKYLNLNSYLNNSHQPKFKNSNSNNNINSNNKTLLDHNDDDEHLKKRFKSNK